MNKKIIFLALLVIIIALVVFELVPAALDILNVPVSEDSSDVLISVPDDTSTLKVGQILEDNDLIRSRFAFLIKVKSSEYNGKLNSGTHTLNKSMTISEIMAIMSKPRVVMETVSVTFPEGYSLEQMAELLEEKKIVSKDGFLDALAYEYDFEFIGHIPDGDYKYALQGFLFPSTYEFYKNSKPEDVVEKMLTHFNEMYLSAADSFDGVFETIIKASLIEKEAKLEEERATISGVIKNRTELGMAYQIDASVLYAATDGLYNREESAFISQNIRELDSPYNTYMYKGLPAGPICNPGLTSIKAALNPEEHSYLYYHTDTNKNDGSHIFTETFNEHINTMN